MNDQSTPEGTPPEGDPTPQAGNPDPPEGPETISLEDAKKLRSEAKNLRDRLKEAESKLKEREDADLSATQKLEREKAALEAEKSQLQTRVRDAEVRSVAAEVGVKPDLLDTVAVLIDWDEVDANDRKAILRAVKEIVKERPSLSGKSEGLEGGRRSPNSGEPSADDIIRAAARRGGLR